MSGVCCTFADSPDAEGVGRPFLTSPIHFSNSSTRRLAGSRKRCASSPVFFIKAPGRPVSRLVFSPLGKARGLARQVTQPFVLCRPVFPLENTGAPLGAPPGQARAVRAYLPAFSLRHRAVLFVGRSNSKRTIRQPSSWRAALVGHQTGSRCRPGACLRGTPAGAASLLHHQTPLDDAPR
jgi:hypothetical protein